MSDREYFLKQAATCLRLARSTTDEAVAQKLHALAAEFQQKAAELENKERGDRPGKPQS
jgi:hypothetical protein